MEEIKISRTPLIRTYRKGKTHSGYTYYEIDISSLGEYIVSNYHYRYKCPWCSSDVDKEKKLYFNFNTGIGFCFRCETVVVNRQQRSQPIKVNLFQFSWLNFLDQNIYRDISWTETALISNEVKIYLSKRKYPYGNDIIQEFNFRWFKGVKNETVLLLPNNSPDRLHVDSFQTTVVAGRNKGSGPKYTTYSDNKVLYFLDKSKNPKTILFVEGIFDAISVSDYIGDRNIAVCPLLGKSLSKSQQHQFYNFLKNNNNPNEIMIILDGEVKDRDKIKLGRQLLAIDSSINVYFVNLPDKLDPEEAVGADMFDNSYNKAKRILV